MVFREKKIEFGMEVLAAMDAHLQSFVNDVLAKLEDASLRLLIIACILHFLDEIVRIGIDDGLFINLSEKEFGLLTEYVVDIDTYQYLYLFDVFKFLTKFEIARASEISYYGLKGMKIKHIMGYSLELLEQGIIWSIIEKLSAHLLYLLGVLALPPFP